MISHRDIDSFILEKLRIQTGLNKREEIKRLVYEIVIYRRLSLGDISEYPQVRSFLSGNLEGSARFRALKEILTGIRFPSTVSRQKGLDMYLPRVEEIQSPPVRGLSPDLSPVKIFIQNSIRENPLAKKALQKYPGIPVTFFDELQDLRQDRTQLLGDMGKRDLYIVREAFDIVKPCPCTEKAVRCNYFILNLGFGCPFDCSYCYLQHYSNRPGIYLPANLDGFFAETEKILSSGKYRFLRIGTGEFSDSLALDSLTGYARVLVEFFRDKKCLFEFKTKSDEIQGLLSVSHVPGNISISWSLNPQKVITTEELYAPGLRARFDASVKLVKKGYHVGFHFDPLIPYAGWEQDYFAVVDEMFTAVKGHIAWISLGVLRFYRKLRNITDQRFPEDPYLYGELLLDHTDNKMRYPESLRIDVLRKMLQKIRSVDADVPVYLCMEPPEIWKAVFGRTVQTAEIEGWMGTGASGTHDQ